MKAPRFIVGCVSAPLGHSHGFGFLSPSPLPGPLCALFLLPPVGHLDTWGGSLSLSFSPPSPLSPSSLSFHCPPSHPAGHVAPQARIPPARSQRSLLPRDGMGQPGPLPNQSMGSTSFTNWHHLDLALALKLSPMVMAGRRPLFLTTGMESTASQRRLLLAGVSLPNFRCLCRGCHRCSLPTIWPAYPYETGTHSTTWRPALPVPTGSSITSSGAWSAGKPWPD